MKIEIRVVLYSLAFVLIIGLVYYEHTQVKNEKNTIFNQINLLASNKIESIAVINVDQGKMMTPEEISITQGYLKSVDFKNPSNLLNPGEHDPLTYRYIFIFKLKNNKVYKFAGDIFLQRKEKRDDLFLSNNAPYSWETHVRVRGYGKWMIENIPPRSKYKASDRIGVKAGDKYW